MPLDGIQRTIFLTETGCDFEKNNNKQTKKPTPKQKKCMSKVLASSLIYLEYSMYFHLSIIKKNSICTPSLKGFWAINPYQRGDLYKIISKNHREFLGLLGNLT